MDFMTIIGIVMGALAVYFVMARGQIVHLLANLDAFVLVFGGTLASTLIAYPWSTLKEIPKAFRYAFFPRKRESAIRTIEILVSLSEKAKRSGVEALSNDIHNIKSRFFVNSIRMLIDGFEPDIIQGNMEKEIIYVQQRHQKVTSVFRMMATIAPIFGLLGTLIGVVQVLKNITDPKTMGASMAIAVTTTFYGIFSANFMFLPIAVKLSEYSEDEILNMELILEGVLSLQKGDVPLVTEKKLEAFLSAILREKQIQTEAKLPK
ncbi:MAG: MotA/TolQ/ExbB proton channel family protein [Elusimicrobia bacterium]|nr:MotA/TolQ/ExbB proton channel family protein [Elusimicrobiota bacterium]